MVKINLNVTALASKRNLSRRLAVSQISGSMSLPSLAARLAPRSTSVLDRGAAKAAMTSKARREEPRHPHMASNLLTTHTCPDATQRTHTTGRACRCMTSKRIAWQAGAGACVIIAAEILLAYWIRSAAILLPPSPPAGPTTGGLFTCSGALP